MQAAPAASRIRAAPLLRAVEPKKPAPRAHDQAEEVWVEDLKSLRGMREILKFRRSEAVAFLRCPKHWRCLRPFLVEGGKQYGARWGWNS